jgi:hypothetical protein
MSLFDGTWRPDPQRPGPDAPVEELLLADGAYACLTCSPPYRVAADGQAHPIDAAKPGDTVAISVIDDRTVRRVVERDGVRVVEATTVLSPFGHTKRETQHRLDSGPVGLDFEITSRRVADGPAGAHRLSGRWQVVEADLPNHEEDTSYRIADGVLSMRDGFGRSFDAPLDGTVVPYRGDSRFTTVSCRQLDDATIEEVDRRGQELVLTTTWRVDPDGRTIHVRFEYANGLVQDQDGQRLD